MKNKVPQKSDFEKASINKRSENICRLIIFVISFFAVIYDWFDFQFAFFEKSIFMLSVLLAFLLLWFQWRFKEAYRKAEQTRRDGFLDNAFNTKIADIASEGYYDTDNVEEGIRKVLANLHESTFFSFQITEKMIKTSTIELLVSLGLLIGMVLINLFNAQFIIVLVDIFISSDILMDYLELKELNKKMELVHDNCKKIWETYAQKYHTADNKTTASILREYLRYESALSYASIMFNEKIYIESKVELESKWEEFKKRYNMEHVKESL